jgi:hypothetical protein
MASIVVNGDTSGAVTLSAPAVAGTVTVTLPATSGTMLTTASSTGVSGSAISSGTVAEAYGGTGTNTGYYGFKSRIINGAMVIDQRNAGASVSGNGVYTLDRWYAQASVNSKYTVQQNAGSVTPPAGFANYLGVTSSSAYTVGASENFSLLQAIEGYNMADFAWGTASASSVTLSFRVYSSLTGTFGGSLQNSAQNRSYPFTYTISSANTWTTISVTIAGDQSGTWLKTNGAGIYMWIGLGVGATVSGTAGSWSGSNYVGATGATSVVGTNGATFYITGVQLEKGSTATSFDYRPYGTELQLCQRYFVLTNTSNTAKNGGAWGSMHGTTTGHITGALPVPLRAGGTVTFGGTSNTFYVSNVNATSAGTPVNSSVTSLIVDFEISGMSSGAVGYPIQYNGQMSISAEL